MRRGNFGGANMNKMMKQMQEMQKRLEETQRQIEEQEVTGQAGGGMVEAKVNGKKEVLSVKINPDLLDPEEVEMLEDMIVVAINEAIKKAEEISEREMGKITGGLNIPGL